MKTEHITVGKTYNYFDDGKIRESRRYSVEITEIIPFTEANLSLIEDWAEEVKECYWLYAEKTTHFIKGILTTYNGKTEEIIFVQTVNDGWFSLGWWGGRLDVDGKLEELSNQLLLKETL